MIRQHRAKLMAASEMVEPGGGIGGALTPRGDAGVVV
jgi:hypothetical protein